MKKIVTLCSAVLGAILLAGCAQQQTSQTQPMSPVPATQPPAPMATEQTYVEQNTNWKTYTNTKYYFTLKYPEGWNHSEAEYPQSLQDSAVKGDDYVGPEVFTLSLGKDDPGNADSGIGMTVKKRENNNPVVPQEFVEDTITIGGVKGIKYSGSYFVEENGYIYQLYPFGGNPYYDDYFEKVVSTFYFIK